MRWGRTLFPLRWTQYLGPVVLAGATAGLLAIIVITSGMLDLGASTPHPQGWAGLLHYTFKRSTAQHAEGVPVPVNFVSPAQIAKGAAYYGTACAHCHGGPGLGQNPIALSMTPRPQYLVQESKIFNARELFYIVKHGVKYSGMPSYPVQDRDDEIWSIVAFLRIMPKLTTAQYRGLAYGDAMGAQDHGAVPALANGVPTNGYRLPHSDEPPVDQYRYAYPAIGFDAFSVTGGVVQTCARCHTGNGAGRADGAIPNIAILDKAYFRTALEKYASGNRHSGFMQPVAIQLDPAQMTALAQYYSGQARHHTDTAPLSADDRALGEHLAAIGIQARGVGACSSCHDVTRAANKAYPGIDGQHRAYLAGRMRQFRSAPPTGGGGNPMIAIAKHLDDREIDAVSGYYAAREPAAPSPIRTAGLAR